MEQMLVDKSASTHIYRQVKKAIQRQVREKNFQPGDKIKSVAEMARKFQISTATVAKATAELIEDGFLYSKHGSGTFVADPARKKTHTICFVIRSADYITEPYFSQIIAGIGKVTDTEHYKLQFITSERTVRAISGGLPYPPVKENQWADGLIIMDNAMSDDQVARLAEEFPLVLIDRKIRGTDIACVRADDRGGTYQAISHLASLGHRRIGMMVMSRIWQTDKEKLLGYRSAVDDLGLDADESLVVDYGPLEKDGVKLAVDRLLDLPSPPTAIFVSDDMPAFDVIQRLRERGVCVGKDIAVMSFGGCLSDMLRVQSMPLTTMQIPITEMGQAAAKMLLALINNEDVTEREAIFSPELIIRQSCGGKVKMQVTAEAVR